MYPLIRSLLFHLPPEQAHTLTLALLRLAGSLPPVRALLRCAFAAPGEPTQAFGLRFANPVGLAAGYDKDALAWRGLACLGFGHIEVGTVTPLPQPGNSQPRLFRLPEAQALINRMGFPGKGAKFVAHQLHAKRPPGLVLGVNIGKGVHTPLEDAVNDYLELLETFAPLADYLAINVSSPNTLGLRQLQARQALHTLLSQLAERRRQWLSSSQTGQSTAITRTGAKTSLPLLVKLSPDLNESELDDALDVILATGMDGVIASNTTTNRQGIENHPLAGEAGGLSGAPLQARSLHMLRHIVEHTDGKLPAIGVGGIQDAASARRMLDAGASLVQLYTGLVYAGPNLVRETLHGDLRA